MPLKAERIVFSDEAQNSVRDLEDANEPQAASILKRITFLEQRLIEDCQAGEVIPFPLSRRAKLLESRHAPLRNLYCCDLPDFWRLLYTIVRDGATRIAYVLEIVDHPTYDKWFPGRGR